MKKRNGFLAALALGFGLLFAQAPAPAQASSLYCRSWRTNDGYSIKHCTGQFHYSNSHVVSDNPRWVPNGAIPAFYLANHVQAMELLPVSGGGSTKTPSPVSSKGHSPNHYPFGQCTYWAAATAHDNVDYLGNAGAWFHNAQLRGLPTGYTPRVGATVVFQGGVQGASALGHVAHVTAVASNGTFSVSEMNTWGLPGSGFGKVVYQSGMHTGPGVGFIY